MDTSGFTEAHIQGIIGKTKLFLMDPYLSSSYGSRWTCQQVHFQSNSGLLGYKEFWEDEGESV